MSLVGLVLAVATALPLSSSAVGVRRAEPVAIVYVLQGEAVQSARGRPGGVLRLFEWLPAGTTIETGPAARLTLAFANGRRYALGGGARVTLGREDLASRAGPVRPLPRVPSFPVLLAIRREDRPGPRAGAVRIRTETIRGLYPRDGAATLADETLLRFQPVDGTPRYRIEVQDGRGVTVFRADAAAPPVRVPPGILLAGAGYHWTVRTLDRPGGVARGEAGFTLVPRQAAKAREEARAVLAREGPGSLALLAATDLSLGLLLEARQELLAALDADRGNAGLVAALAEVDRRLEDDDAQQ